VKWDIGICIIILFFSISCRQPKNVTHETLTAIEGLVPISTNDTSYTNYFNVQKETTPNGWEISYMVKNDTTRYTDAYIQWKKGGIVRVYKYAHVLKYRGQFMPQFLQETETYIFMDHACATECWAILALPKNNTAKAIDFEDILGFNFDLGQIVYKNYTKDDKLKITATDFNRNKTKSVIFKNKYYSLGSMPLDTLIFKGDRIQIDCDFFDKDGVTIEETHTIKF
jgi:hypothetical protein